MVVGILAKNDIPMLDAVEDNLAAILGMAPLALAIGSGSELLQPLAIAVIGGLPNSLVR